MATLRQTGTTEYELTAGGMWFSLRLADGRLVATGGGRSERILDDEDWDQYCLEAETEANALFAEIAVLDIPTSEILHNALALCDTGLANWICRHPQDIGAVGSRGLEKLIAEILRTFGFEVQLTPQTRDGGYDILAVTRDALGISTHYPLECKHPTVSEKVGVVPVRALYGVKERTRAEHAILVTSFWFTRDAWTFANDPHVWNLHLRDRDALLEWLGAYRRLKAL